MLATSVALLLALAFPVGTHAFGPLSSFSTSGQAAGQTGLAAGLAVGPDGLLYVADFSNNRIDVFSPSGDFIRAFGKEVNPSGGNVCTMVTGCRAATSSTAAGAFYAPMGIDIDSSGNVYVADWWNNRISVFKPDGTFIHTFGKGVSPLGGDICTAVSGCRAGVGDGSAGAVYNPTGIEIDPDGKIYISSPNHRIDVFYETGAFIRAFGEEVNPSGGDVCTPIAGCQRGKAVDSAGALSSPYDVVEGPSGEIAVSDSGNRRISVFNPDGTFIHAFGLGVNPADNPTKLGLCTVATGCRKGTEDGIAGAPGNPFGLAVDGTGNLIVADTRNHRLSEFTFDGGFIRAFGEGVIDGTFSFQVCTIATGCRMGTSSGIPGAIPFAWSTAVDCRGAIYASAVTTGTKFPQLKRFGEPTTASPPCTVPSPAPEGPVSEESFLPASTPRSRSVKPTFKVELNQGSGTATLAVVVSESGTLRLSGKGIRTVKLRVKRIGLVELPVIPKKALRRKLEQTGKAKVKVELTFTPDKGPSNTQFKSLILKMAPRF